MKRILYVKSIFLLLIICKLEAQIKFQIRYYLGNLLDMPVTVMQLPDKGYLMAGWDIATLGLTYAIDLIKVDSTGAYQWANMYHSGTWWNPFANPYELGNLSRNQDGTYIMCGKRENDLFITKLDANFGVSWIKGYDIGIYDKLNYIKQTSDGGYIAVGETRLTSTDSLNALIIKFNSSGNISWAIMWNYSSINSNDALYCVEEETGIGYIAVGYASRKNVNDTTKDILIIKTDLNGNIIFQNLYGSLQHDEYANYITKKGNTFYLIGSTTQDAFLATDLFFMSISSNGIQNFVKTYNFGLVDDGFKVLTLTNGNFVLVGGDLFSNNIFSIIVDPLGNPLNAMSYSQGFSFPLYVDAYLTHDNGYVFLTQTIDFGYYLFKTDLNGNTGCYENAFTSNVNTTSFEVTAVTGSSIPNINSITASMNRTSYDNLSNIIEDCKYVPCDTPIVTITPAAPIICQGQSVTLTASGNNWSGPCTSFLWNTGQTESSITVSPNTTTTYTVVGYVGNCPSNPTSVTVTVNPIPNVQISGPDYICLGDNATLTASGGIAYLWSTGSSQSTISVSPTTTTTYTVTVTNQYNCTATASHTITVNPLPTASIVGPTTTCAGDSVTLTANGGINFFWSTTENTQTITVMPVMTTTYYVTVTDQNNCTATASHTVSVNPKPIISFAGDTSICIGESTIITASGGDYYLWSNGSTSNSIEVTGNIGYYQYFVTVSFATGCSSVGSITIGIHEIPQAQATGGQTICQGQSVQLSASGGTNYSWAPTESLDNPNSSTPIATPYQTTTYIVTVYNQWGCYATASTTVNVLEAPTFTAVITDVKCYGGNDGSITLTNISGQPPFNIIWNTGSTNQSITNLYAGTYSVTVTNALNCSTVQTYLVNQPEELQAISNINNVLCYGENSGSISITTTGGIPPYSYIWSNGQTNHTATNLSTGYYAVTIIDANNCSKVLTNLFVNQPSQPLNIILDSIKHVSCYGINDGNIKVNANGGTPPYSYHWSNGQTGNYIVNLYANTYYLTVKDANNCSIIDSFKITQPEPLKLIITHKKPYCYLSNDGSILVSLIGGREPYKYFWDNSDTSNIRENLTPGEYKLTVVDANKCYVDTTIKLDYLPNECIKIPTMISPNADGKNDKFEIVGIQFFNKVRIIIFDKWGNEVFKFEGKGIEYHNPNNQWDGSFYTDKYCAPCSYFYIVEIIDTNEIFKGIVTVIK